jgi:hypothetical protein
LIAVSKHHLVTECLHAIGLITHELLMNLRNINFQLLTRISPPCLNTLLQKPKHHYSTGHNKTTTCVFPMPESMGKTEVFVSGFLAEQISKRGKEAHLS